LKLVTKVDASTIANQRAPSVLVNVRDSPCPTQSSGSLVKDRKLVSVAAVAAGGGRRNTDAHSNMKPSVARIDVPFINASSRERLDPRLSFA
jgi:hypothetical protein